MDTLKKLLESTKNNIGSKLLNTDDAKKIIKDSWYIVKKQTNEKINIVKTRSFELSKDSVKMVFSTTGKVIYHVSKFGVNSFFMLLNKTKIGLYFKVLFGSYVLARSTYVYGTYDEDTITVKSKWVPNSKKAINEYKIESSEGKMFLLKNVIWYFPMCDADQNFGKIEKNKTYTIKYYGSRYFDIFGFYPTIINTEEKYF